MVVSQTMYLELGLVVVVVVAIVAKRKNAAKEIMQRPEKYN
jgi:hypothetical protein